MSNTLVKTMYDGKHTLEFNPGNHRYKVNGKYSRGVTSMLARLDKGAALTQWAANCAVEHLKDYNAAHGGLAKEAFNDAKFAYLNKRDTAADIGKRAHAWIETYLLGTSSPGTEFETEIESDIEHSVKGFIKWWNATRPIDVQSEQVVYSELYDYCGTVDMVFNKSDDERTYRTILDFKTGSPEREYKKGVGYTGKLRPYLTHLYQCALYDQALAEEFGIFADRYSVVYLSKTGEVTAFTTEYPHHYREPALKLVELLDAEKPMKDTHFWRSAEFVTFASSLQIEDEGEKK